MFAPVIRSRVAVLAALLLLAFPVKAAEEQGQIWMRTEDGVNVLRVLGKFGMEWRFQTSADLRTWTNAPNLGSLFSGAEIQQASGEARAGQQFIRAIKTDGLFDTNLLRTVSLTFSEPNWFTLLAQGRWSGSNLSCTLELDNGLMVQNVGARHKGNSSYDLGGSKKSINLDINWVDPEARVLGYRAINLNNAAGDYTIMREALYFNVMREYTPCPRAALARLEINGQYWGVYSMVDQLNKDLLDEWFPGNDGDRWRAPNIGKGGFDSGASAFTYLGPIISRYTNHYELKSDYSTEAWTRLVNACDILNNTPAGDLRVELEKVFAVDRWLWFLAIENVFVDDDSYWFKGADYSFYYEPESGRFHPVEHDGNEAFYADMGVNYNLSPVHGANLSSRPLLSKMLNIPELRQRYLAHMRTLLEERFNPEYMDPFINHFHHLSAEEIAADPKKNFTMASCTNALTALKRYVANRYNYLTDHPELRPNPPRIKAVSGPSLQPGPADVPFITAQVEGHEEDGVDSVWLYFRDKPYGSFSSAQMFDDGNHEDGAANDGWYGAATEAFPAGNIVQFYIEARSGNSTRTAAFSPARAEQETYTYRVGLASSPYSPVLINEFMADNASTLRDPQGNRDDWIELRNLTPQEIDLTGLYLTDKPENPRKWPFPAGTVIPANGYLLVWADEEESDTPGLHANFKLGKSGEQILLIDRDENLNAVLDAVTFGPQTTDISLGRPAANPETFESMEPTPGQPNY